MAYSVQIRKGYLMFLLEGIKIQPYVIKKIF